MIAQPLVPIGGAHGPRAQHVVLDGALDQAADGEHAALDAQLGPPAHVPRPVGLGPHVAADPHAIAEHRGPVAKVELGRRPVEAAPLLVTQALADELGDLATPTLTAEVEAWVGGDVADDLALVAAELGDRGDFPAQPVDKAVPVEGLVEVEPPKPVGAAVDLEGDVTRAHRPRCSASLDAWIPRSRTAESQAVSAPIDTSFAVAASTSASLRPASGAGRARPWRRPRAASSAMDGL